MDPTVDHFTEKATEASVFKEKVGTNASLSWSNKCPRMGYVKGWSRVRLRSHRKVASQFGQFPSVWYDDPRFVEFRCRQISFVHLFVLRIFSQALLPDLPLHSSIFKKFSVFEFEVFVRSFILMFVASTSFLEIQMQTNLILACLCLPKPFYPSWCSCALQIRMIPHIISLFV